MPGDFDFIVADARIDLKQWDKAIAQMEADARQIDNLFKTPLEITVKVTDSGLRDVKRQLDTLGSNIGVDVRFSATGDDIETLREAWDDDLQTAVKFSATGDDIPSLRDLLDNTINTDVKFNATGDDVIGLRDAIDDGIDVDVKFNATGDDIAQLTQVDDVEVKVKATEDASVDSTLSDIESKLDDLKKYAKIQLILDAAGFVKDIGELPLIGSLLEIDQLTKQVTGRTGRDLENVGRTINNVYTANWGDSKEEIAGVITTIAQLRDTTGDFLVDVGDLESVAVGAFQAASIGGSEATETLRAATQMVKNGFVPSFQEAFDIIAEGYTRGFDQSGDYLDTLIEYSSTYSQLGISANGFFNILRGGTEAGVFNTDKMADAFKEMLNLTKEEVAIYQTLGDETDRTRALAETGLMDEATAYAAGELSGDEFSQAVIDTLVAKFEDPAEQQRLAKAIFSPTMVEDAGLPAILQTNLTETNIWTGQAENLSNELFSGTADTWTTLQRTVETYFLDALINSVEAREFMDKITAAAQRFGTELTSGATIGEALEVALEIPGLSDQISQLESVLGNFLLDFIAALANVGEALGADVSGLREAVSRYGAGQLAYDLKVATDEEEIAGAIQRAIDRGVSGAETTQAISTAVTEMLDQGNVARAQELVDNLSQLPEIPLGEKATAVLEAAGNDVDVALQALLQAREQVQNDVSVAGQAQLADINQAIVEMQGKWSEVDTEALQSQVNAYVSTLNQELQAAVASGDFNLAETLGTQLGIQNIGQFISEQKAQPVIDALFPKPSASELQGYVFGLNTELFNALSAGDFTAGAALAEQLMPFDDPNVTALIDDFATTLMIQFNNALYSGDTETASDILTVLGLSPEANQIALDSMTQRLADFQADATYTTDAVGGEFNAMGDQITQSTADGEDGVTSLYDAILAEKGVLGTTRLDSLAKRFEAVSAAISDVLKQINKAENQVGEGAVEGAAVGGMRGPGVTMVGEAGREMIFSDERFAVLNNQTTERLYSALSNMMGGSNSTVNNTRTVNYSPTIFVQNDAQAALFSSQGLNQLRGEAY